MSCCQVELTCVCVRVCVRACGVCCGPFLVVDPALTVAIFIKYIYIYIYIYISVDTVLVYSLYTFFKKLHSDECSDFSPRQIKIGREYYEGIHPIVALAHSPTV